MADTKVVMIMIIFGIFNIQIKIKNITLQTILQGKINTTKRSKR